MCSHGLVQNNYKTRLYQEGPNKDRFPAPGEYFLVESFFPNIGSAFDDNENFDVAPQHVPASIHTLDVLLTDPKHNAYPIYKQYKSCIGLRQGCVFISEII